MEFQVLALPSEAAGHKRGGSRLARTPRCSSTRLGWSEGHALTLTRPPRGKSFLWLFSEVTE